MLKIPDMPPVFEGWLDGVVPTWTSLNAERIDSLPGKQPFEDGAICLAINLTDDEIAASLMLPNVFALMLAAESADGFELTANGNLTRETATAMREATDWLGCLFEEKWRAGKQLREGCVEELRLLRDVVTIESLLIGKQGRPRFGATGSRALKGHDARPQANFFRNCFWDASLDLLGEPECSSWPQGLIGPAQWSLSTTGDRWQHSATLTRLSLLPDEAVLHNSDWVPPALHVLRPLRWFALVECRGEDETRTGYGEWRKTPLFDRFVEFDLALVEIGTDTVH